MANHRASRIQPVKDEDECERPKTGENQNLQSRDPTNPQTEADYERQIGEYRQTILLMNEKIRKMDQLLKVKDAKIAALMENQKQ